MNKIVLVAHCILNTCAKVELYDQESVKEEEALRVKLMKKVIETGTQVIQLPCPEFTLYGAMRWGHVSNQFDNPFFRKHCRTILNPIFEQIEEYLQNSQKYEILGIIGVDGSPSCGVDYTSCGDWFGSFGCRENLKETLSSVRLEKKKGIFFDELEKMIVEKKLQDQLKVVGLFANEPEKCLSLL